MQYMFTNTTQYIVNTTVSIVILRNSSKDIGSIIVTTCEQPPSWEAPRSSAPYHKESS